VNISDIDQGDVLWMTDLRRGTTSAVTVLDIDTTSDRVTAVDEDGRLWDVSPGFLARR